VGVEIRLASEDDLEGIMRIEKACFREDRFDIGTVRTFLRRKDSFVVVAVEGDDVVGAAMCACSTRLARGRIASVAVLEEHRRRGTGAVLLEASEDELRTRGVGTAVLEVDVDNESAVKLYVSHGYDVKGTMRDYYSRGRDAFYMEKDIAMRGRRVRVRPS
jgi:ribosomal protein S18 acetylase RimI-like enzyme